MLRRKLFRKAGAVGVVADTPAVGEQHGIDRPDRARIGTELVQPFDHRLLAGKGDIQPGKTFLFG
jgi:hypothetical protein